MNLKNTKVNTRSVSNFENDFKKYLGTIKDNVALLEQSIEKYGNLVYTVDCDFRNEILENIEFLEVFLIKFYAENNDFSENTLSQLTEIKEYLDSLYTTTNHQFFLVAYGKILLITTFIEKNFNN